MDSRSLSTILCKPLPYLRRFVKICKDVVIEPPLLPLTGETLPPGSSLSDGARLDVSHRNLWSPLDKVFIDVRVFNPQAESNWKKTGTSRPAFPVSPSFLGV